jgi:hypothetical protein
MLVSRNDEPPKLHDAVVHSKVDVAVVEPGLGADPVVQCLMQSGIINPLSRFGNLNLAKRAHEIAARDDPDEAALSQDGDPLDPATVEDVSNIREFRIITDRDDVPRHDIVGFEPVRLGKLSR